MMIIMRTGATQQQIAVVVSRIEQQGLRAHLSTGAERTVIGAIGDGRPVNQDQFLLLPGVDRVVPISRPYKLASREFIPNDSTFPLNGLEVSPGEVLIIGGPCAVESRDQIIDSAYAVQKAGAHALRGGAYKPRTSPYAFQGLMEEGLMMLAEARRLTGLPIVSEAMSPSQVPLVAAYADVIQIGTRNMQNYALLHAVGETNKPVLLKRGMSASIDELLMAAEYILSHGNKRVILCERGIRTFETSTRNTTDINAIPVLKSRTHLPVFLDPSHSTGHWEYVNSIALAAIAAGADGLLVEVHPNPEKALSDGGQSLKPERFADLVRQVEAIAKVLGRTLASQPVIPIHD